MRIAKRSATRRYQL